MRTNAHLLVVLGVAIDLHSICRCMRRIPKTRFEYWCQCHLLALNVLCRGQSKAASKTYARYASSHHVYALVHVAVGLQAGAGILCIAASIVKRLHKDPPQDVRQSRVRFDEFKLAKQIERMLRGHGWIDVSSTLQANTSTAHKIAYF